MKRSGTGGGGGGFLLLLRGAAFDVDISSEHLSEVFRPSGRGRELDVRIAAQSHVETDVAFLHLDMHIANGAAASAIERVGDAQNRRELAHDVLLRIRERREVVV